MVVLPAQGCSVRACFLFLKGVGEDGRGCLSCLFIGESWV
jgi:hypothetical protein